MSDYELTIQFDPSSLRGETFTITKDMNAGNPVVWLQFRPLGTNVLSWEDDSYTAFVGRSEEAVPGMILRPGKEYPVKLGKEYVLYQGRWEQPGDAPDHHIRIGAAPSGPGMTCGLSQAARLNGSGVGGPIGVTYLPETIHPRQRVALFKDSVQGGQVLSRVPDHALTVDLAEDPEQTVHWDASTGRFAPGPL